MKASAFVTFLGKFRIRDLSWKFPICDISRKFPKASTLGRVCQSIRSGEKVRVVGTLGSEGCVVIGNLGLALRAPQMSLSPHTCPRSYRDPGLLSGRLSRRLSGRLSGRLSAGQAPVRAPVLIYKAPVRAPVRGKGVSGTVAPRCPQLSKEIAGKGADCAHARRARRNHERGDRASRSE